MAAVPAPVPKRFSREEFYRLGELGFLDDRVELVNGEIYQLPPKGPEHATVSTLLHQLLSAQLPAGFHVRDGVPLDLGNSQPQPDLAIVTGERGDYRTAHPQTAVLVVEVADTSLDHDRRSKATIYAWAGINEYWIVDLAAKQVLVLRSPSNGDFESLEVKSQSETLIPVSLPGVRVTLSDLL